MIEEVVVEMPMGEKLAILFVLLLVIFLLWHLAKESSDKIKRDDARKIKNSIERYKRNADKKNNDRRMM